MIAILLMKDDSVFKRIEFSGKPGDLPYIIQVGNHFFTYDENLISGYGAPYYYYRERTIFDASGVAGL